MAKPINLQSFKEFFNSSSIGGLLLLACVAISLIIANTSFAESFQGLLDTEIGIDQLRYPVITWVNDGLMAVFFLLVGLEIKREIVEGELSSLRKASLPVLAAIGGVIVPALIYNYFNNSTPTANGWGIPMATDIAFALAILSLLGNRIPTGLKVFLAALAIADDLIAILVIALFYSAELHWDCLAYAAGIFALQITFNRIGFKNLLFYVLPGAVMWYFIHHSGIHATIAGVLTALTLPTTPDDTESPLEKLEHLLTRPVNLLIMPAFALANTNITFESTMPEGLLSSLGYGIIGGLFIGKPIGIVLMSWLSVKLKMAQLPERTTWHQIIGIGFLGGIGFTMSIFIALLSFDTPDYQTEAKFAVLIASILSGICGFMLLKCYRNKN